MRIVRKIHLWVGILLSLILLCEGLTGFILAEPGMFAQPAPEIYPRQSGEQNAQTELMSPRPGERNIANAPRERNSILTTARMLHEGRIGNLNLRWLVALSGIGMAVLSLTGLYMAIVFFRR